MASAKYGSVRIRSKHSRNLGVIVRKGWLIADSHNYLIPLNSVLHTSTTSINSDSNVHKTPSDLGWFEETADDDVLCVEFREPATSYVCTTHLDGLPSPLIHTCSCALAGLSRMASWIGAAVISISTTTTTNPNQTLATFSRRAYITANLSSVLEDTLP